MGTRHALDLRIEIAELFDTGRLSGRVTIDEIATLVHASRYSVDSNTRSLNFHVIEKRERVLQEYPTLYAPPRKWRKLTGRHRPLTHRVRDLFLSGQISGRCSTWDIAPLVGESTKSVGLCLKALGFKVVKQKWHRIVGWTSPIVEPPREWPPLFLLQCELRRARLSAASVVYATDPAAGLPEIIKAAMQQLDVADIPLQQRGQLRKSIKDVIRTAYRELKEEHIPSRELAMWLKERTDTDRAALQARVEGYASAVVSNRELARWLDMGDTDKDSLKARILDLSLSVSPQR